MARTPLRALRALRAVTDWPSHGAASLHSAACSGYLHMTALTQKTTPPPCTATSPKAPSKTMWGSAQTSARINLSSQQQHWQDTQVRRVEVESFYINVLPHFMAPFYSRHLFLNYHKQTVTHNSIPYTCAFKSPGMHSPSSLRLVFGILKENSSVQQ